MIENGEQIRRPRKKKTIRDDKIIARLTENLDSGRYTTLQFLEQATYRIEAEVPIEIEPEVIFN